MSDEHVGALRRVDLVSAINRAYADLCQQLGVAPGSPQDVAWRGHPDLSPLDWLGFASSITGTGTVVQVRPAIITMTVPYVQLRLSIPENAAPVLPRRRDRARPNLEEAAAAYVRRACGLCLDPSCTNTPTTYHRLVAGEVRAVSRSTPLRYCDQHYGDAERLSQSLTRLRRGLGLTN